MPIGGVGYELHEVKGAMQASGLDPSTGRAPDTSAVGSYSSASVRGMYQDLGLGQNVDVTV